MSVTSIREQTAKRMGKGDGNGEGVSYACTACGMSTDHATLATFGARCFPCYQAYRREPPPSPERSPYAQAVRAEIARLGKELRL